MQTKLLLNFGVGAIAAVLSISTALPLSAEQLRFSNVSSLNSAASDGGIKALSTAAAPLSLAAGQNGLVPSAMLVITTNAKVTQPKYQSLQLGPLDIGGKGQPLRSSTIIPAETSILETWATASKPCVTVDGPALKPA